MRIAQIVASLEARHGGPSRSVLGLAQGLAAIGHDVELLTTEPGAQQVEQPAERLTIRRFPRVWPQALAASPRLDGYLRSRQFDLIHNHGLWLRPLHYAARAARRSGSALVISPRGMATDWAWHYRRMRKFAAGHLVHPGAFKTCAGWHATSTAEAVDIRQRGFSQPVCVAANGVALPDARECEEARRHWLARIPALTGRRVALFYSRFHPKKRILELIELWAEAAPPDWLLLAVGIPEAYSVTELTQYASRCNAANRISVFDGTEVPAPYAASSLYLLPSHSENFGLTVAEAMAHGLPVITTDTTPWLGLTSRRAGHCVPWSGFRAALQTALAQPPAELAAQGARGRAWVEADYTWESSARILAEFYDRITRPQL